MRRRHRSVRLRRGFAIAISVLALSAPAAPAFAHGEGDSAQSRVLVVDALSYLANRPSDYMDMAMDKIGDALEAPDRAGVDLAKVTAAQRAMDAGDMMRTRALLEASLKPLTRPVVGMDTGTVSMPDPMSGHTDWSSVAAVYAGLSALLMLIGLVLAVRWRPRESIKQLRTRLNEEKAS